MRREREREGEEIIIRYRAKCCREQEMILPAAWSTAGMWQVEREAKTASPMIEVPSGGINVGSTADQLALFWQQWREEKRIERARRKDGPRCQLPRSGDFNGGLQLVSVKNWY